MAGFAVANRKFGAGEVLIAEHNSAGVHQYGPDFAPDASVASADSVVAAVANAFDGDTSTSWISSSTDFPHWLKIDMGVGVSKIARRVRIWSEAVSTALGGSGNEVIIQGSQDNSNWEDLISLTVETDIFTNLAAYQEFFFDNFIGYRYYRLYLEGPQAAAAGIIREWQMYEVLNEIGPDFLTGNATMTATNEVTGDADNAIDDNPAVSWATDDTTEPQWIKADMGASVTKVAIRGRLKTTGADNSLGGTGDTVVLAGSNNNSDWTTLTTLVVGTDLIASTFNSFTFTNTTAYRYFRWYMAGPFVTPASLFELELFEQQSVGEIPFSLSYSTDDMLAVTDTLGEFGLGANGIIVEVSTNITPDEIESEMSPVQNIISGQFGLLKCRMNMGNVTKLAIACGLTAAITEEDVLGATADASTIIYGAHPPVSLSLVLKIPNVHNASFFDFVYIPNAKLSKPPTLVFKRDAILQSDVEFTIMASIQDAMRTNNIGALAKVYHQTST